MMTWDPILRTKSDAFASEAQCHDIASSLLAEAGLLESAASRTTSPRSLSIDPKPPSHLREELYPSWSKYLFGQACAVRPRGRFHLQRCFELLYVWYDCKCSGTVSLAPEPQQRSWNCLCLVKDSVFGLRV